MTRKVIAGHDLNISTLPKNISSAIKVCGQRNGRQDHFTIDDDELSRHFLIIGGTGTGKTDLFKSIVSQIELDYNDAMIIFDAKGDYYEKFYRPTKDFFIGNFDAYKKNSLRWNIFNEIRADGDEYAYLESNAREISQMIFKDMLSKTNNIFFPNAASELLVALILAMIKAEKIAGKSVLSNELLRYKCTKSSLPILKDIIRDFPGVINYISGEGQQALGVISEFSIAISNVLQGVFAEKGDFSIRQFVKNRGGKILFIEYDLATGSVLSPVYAMLFDLAIKEALRRKESDRGNLYLILDEMKLMPNLQHLDDGINFGRSLGLKIIAGLQSVNQLDAVYQNTAVARNVIAGFSSLISFRPTDAETRQFVIDRFGTNVVLESFKDLSGMPTKGQRLDANVVENWDLVDLKLGEAVVGLSFGEPFRFKFDKFTLSH